MCPIGERLLAGEGGLLAKARLVCHCLVIETSQGLVLVDTGLGTGDAENPKRLGQPFRAAVRPLCRMDETAVRQLEALGVNPGDVRHIVLTHLDLDHAGGLSDFPDAEVHVFSSELAASKKPPLKERARYISDQFAHGPNWVEHEVEGDSWLGFESVKLLPGVDVEIAMVPLPGHSTGHVGVAINTPDGWLLHCGDAFFHRNEVKTPHSCPPGLRLFQNLVGHDAKTRKQNQERLRELARAHPDDVRLINSHDPELYERAATA